MAKPEREFSADVGQKSMGVAGPDYIEKDFDKAFAMFDPNKNLPDGTPGGIGKENMQPGAADDDVIGNREIDDTQEPTSNIGKYSHFLNWFAYMIKSITGKANWRTKPSYTIEQLGNSTIDGVKNIGGDIDFVAGTGMEITPDTEGKKITFAAKNDTIIPGPHADTHGSIGSDPITPASIGAETPTGAQAKVDTHENKTSTHGATAAATPSRIMMRAANGTAKVAAPVEADDIARKAEVDAHANSPSPHSGHVVMATGQYTGSGEEDRTITVGFAPQYVRIFSFAFVGDGYREEDLLQVRNGTSRYLSKTYHIGVDGTVISDSIAAGVGSSVSLLTDNGVVLRNARMNRIGMSYSWVAFG